MTYIDVTAPLRAMTRHVIETLAITAIFWIAVGYLDRDVYAWRNLVVLAWFLCVLWRFVLPLVRQRRRRFTVTDTEIRVRNDGLFSRTTTIPLQAVRGAGRYRNTITLHTQAGAVHVPGVPKAKRIAETINQLAYS
ncbi:hypothetical protein [Corynebacterium freiburgense]|uniref:hypothetical protein n=1 Tax=Corynebacterium freiburgense TaxID=556548 RepID=UPI00040B188D|nr:hypothetical protein [Corynebacterium freiburgense]WJZ01853.1 hypothetical protein CFREI_02745 [Corynebacterium freiburgense]